MKRVKNLWDKFVSMENLELAAKRAVKSKRNKRVVREFWEHKNEKLRELQKSLIDGTFQTSPYRMRTIYEPKKRIIYILPLYPDHVLHHALINVLGPIWKNMFVRDSYACIPGRGLHAASQRTMQFIRRNKYCLQCDIRKFYPSINHNVMMNILKHKIGDKKLLVVLENIVRSVGGDNNIPIGNLTSQWFGNVYLNELDWFVKQNLRWRDYIRYCDDFLLFGNDKSELAQMRDKIHNFVKCKLKLIFSKSVIFPISRGVDFIGYRHFVGFILLRRYAARKIRHRLNMIKLFSDSSERARGQLAAAYGWMKWACTYNFRQSIKFVVP